MSVLYSLIKSGQIQVNWRSPVLHRFWKNTNKLGPLHPVLKTRCWEWIKSLNKGYGQFHVLALGETLAHRIAYIILVEEIPEGLCVLHHCDNPRCVNPQHLFLGTNLDNIADRNQKGRQASGKIANTENWIRGDKHWSRTNPEKRARGERNGARTCPETRARGERNGGAKLTTEKVLEIRARFKPGDKRNGKAALAREFGVIPYTIYKIIHGLSWKEGQTNA